MARILFLDEKEVNSYVAIALHRDGHHVEVADSIEAARNLLMLDFWDIVVVEPWMPLNSSEQYRWNERGELHGFDFIRELAVSNALVTVNTTLAWTFGNVPADVRALQLPVFEKPGDPDKLYRLIANALSRLDVDVDDY